MGMERFAGEALMTRQVEALESIAGSLAMLADMKAPTMTDWKTGSIVPLPPAPIYPGIPIPGQSQTSDPLLRSATIISSVPVSSAPNEMARIDTFEAVPTSGLAIPTPDERLKNETI